MSPLSSGQLQALKQQLMLEKQAVSAKLLQNEHDGLSESQRDQIGELSLVDNHPADVATEIYERGKDVALNEHSERQLEDIEQALARMETGEYGKCLQCGKPIAFERLQAVPSALYCKEHVPEQHVSMRRPVEEAFLQPPFGRTSTDELDSPAFDGEDAWQIVEHYGTSNSPAMAEEPDVNDYNGMYIEADEPDGFAESIESFLASDLYGKPYEQLIRNQQYRQYMRQLDEASEEQDLASELYYGSNTADADLSYTTPDSHEDL